MSQPALTESQLHVAVEQLRQQHSNTLDLYKAVAGLLFFQYDSTPTTNRMYQLVRKGSMSAPAEALRLFWQELRDRSHVRMEQADIPQRLMQSAGLFVGQLWEESLQQAEKTLEKSNQAIYVKVAATEQAYELALEQNQQLQSALLTAQKQLQKQDEEIDNLQTQLQQQLLQLAALQQQIKTLQEQKQDQQTQHEQQLLLQKEQRLISEQRATEMEKYARLEIERVRQESLKLQRQEQERFEAQQQKMQALQIQYQEQQTTYVELNQQYRYQQMALQKTEEQHQQTEQKNQDLHALLHQLQRQLKQQRPAAVRLVPSRLAQKRAKQ